MYKLRFPSILLILIACSVLSTAQTTPLLKRTTTRTEKVDFASGGTIAIVGAPVGSIRFSGSAGNEVEITAAIEVQAANDADLTRLTEVTGFIVDERLGRVSILSIGTHNKFSDKKMWKKFPKQLANLPFKIDYTIGVPIYSNLEIDGGRGDLSVSNIEGAVRINFVDTTAVIESNGDLDATFGGGRVDLMFGTRSWRGRPANVQMAAGSLNIQLPTNASAEIDASILKTGAIESTFAGLKPRNRKFPFTETSVMAKAGVGGATLKFSVGVGNIKIMPLTNRD